VLTEIGIFFNSKRAAYVVALPSAFYVSTFSKNLAAKALIGKKGQDFIHKTGHFSTKDRRLSCFQIH
jgi:hypothetical protein